MKGFAKKAASVVLALTMVGSMAACSKKSKSNEGLVEAANNVMDALLSESSKKLKKTGEFSDETLMLVDQTAENKAKTVVLKKATYEVDEDSIKESKKSTSVKVKITMPDYEAALEDASDNLDDFLDAIEEQEKGDYKEEEITLKFTSEDDSYSLSDGDDLVKELYMDTLGSLTVFGSEQTVPDKTETEPTDTEPVPDTTPATETSPTETTAPAQPPVASSTAEYDVVIYQDANVIIHFIKADSAGVHMKVENLTSFEITMQGNAFAIDGISITDFTMSDKVAANSTGDIVMDSSPVFSEKVANVSGSLRVVDFDGNIKSYDVLFDTTVIDSSVQAAPAAAKGTLMYEDDKAKIYFAGLDGKGALFEIENLTGGTLHLDVDSLAINTENYSDVHYYDKEFAPHSIGTALLDCKLDASQAVGVVSGLLEISDVEKSFEEYYVTINNAVIDSGVQVAPRALEGSLIMEDGNVRMTYKSMSNKGPVFDIENLSDRDLVVQTESLSLNQRGVVDPYLSVHMAPHSVCEMVAKTDYADGSVQVGMVGGGIVIGDVVDRSNSYMVVLDNVVIDDSVQVSVAPEGTLFYEDEKVKLYYKGSEEKGIIIDVENLSGYSLTVQTRELSINGEKCSGLSLSQDAAPHGITEMHVRCKREGTDPITTISGEFSIFNWTRDFDSYKATFADVTVG